MRARARVRFLAPRLSFASRIIYSEYFVRDNSNVSSESLYSLRLSPVCGTTTTTTDGGGGGGGDGATRRLKRLKAISHICINAAGYIERLFPIAR